MSGRENIVGQCVSVEKVPTGLKEDLRVKICEHLQLSHRDQLNVPLKEIPGYHTDSELCRCIFLLDSKQSADKLCEEVKQEILENYDGKSFELHYERSIECEIPDEWIQMEAASAPGGPGVPPHIPRSTHHPAPAGMATFYQNVPPGQQQGQNQGQYPGPAPFLYPGQYPAASASSVPGQGPGPVPAGMGPGMQHLFMGRGQPGKQHQGQGWPRMPPGYFSPHGQQGEPFYPMPYGYPPFMPFSPQRFPMPPKPGDSDQNLHGQAQGQPGQPSMPFIPWAPSPQMYPGMYNQHVQPHETDQQPHSGPPPPYNGSLPDQMDQAHHDSETEEKHAMEEHKLDELKEPIGRDHDNVPHAVSDQEDYMRRLNRKIQEEQSGKDSDKVEISKMTNNELRQELLEHFKSIGPITDSVRHFYENKLRTVRQSAQSAEDEADGTEKSPDSSSSFEILGTEGQAESDEPQCTIQVTHIPLSVSSEYLQIYFETPKRSGGDDIKELIFKDGDETAFITYETEEVARNVAGRDHYLNQELVQVCLYKPIPPASTNQQNSEQDKGPSRQESETEENPSMIVVRNLPPSASEEYIEMFFENAKRQGGGPVKKVEQYPDDRLAYVEFENPEAVETVLEKLPISMDGHKLEVEVYIPTEEEPVSLCTIMVRGPPNIIASDMLEMYFESGKRSGGGDITDIQREADVAFITYASEEVAQRVVERGQHKVNKKTVEVSLYQPNKQVKKQTSTDETEPPQPSEPTEPLCIVRVEGISHVRSMDTLQFYFENTRRSGGGPISEFEVYKEDDTAYITFEEEKAARRVTERGDHTVEGQCIHATLYEPVRPSDLQQDEEEPLCSIKVMGISKVASKDMLEFYFENARKSGGGSIRELQVHEEEDYAYVTFGGEDVAKRVVDRAHRVDNVDLHVALYRPPKPRPPCTDRLIIKGVSPTTTKDCLFNFLEAKSGASPTQLVYGETEGTVMVTFDSEPDFEKLVKVCERRPLEGSTLSVSKARVSNCIMVSGLKASTTSDTVHYYFENRKRSNGGDIEKVKMSEEPGSCLVLFQNYSVVDDVMKKKHKLEGEELTVQVYIEELGMCQGNGSEPRIKIPDNITIDNIEEKIVDFMKMNDSCKEAVYKQLEGCYAKVVWPEKGTTIVIECEITVKTPEFRKLVKDWKSDVERNFMDYVNLLSCKEHPVWDEGWDDVYKGLGELSIDNPDAVAVFVDKKEKKIRVVGYKHVAESVSKSVDKVIKNVGDEIEMRKQTVKQTISNLKPLQLRMLLASKYPNKMEDKFQKLKVKINQNKNELIYEGVQPDIQAAKVEMYEQINSYSMRVLENIPQNCIDLFHSKPVKDYIVKKLKSQKLVGVWEATDNKLAISSYESSLSNCVEFISESVQEKVIPVKRESSSVLTSQQWIDRITEIHTKNSGVCKINCKEDFTKVYVTATDDLVDELYGTVAKFLKQHTILHEIISLGNKSIVRLIQSHHMDKLGEISKDLTTHYVQIQCDSRGITVQGTEEGLQLAKERLMKFANQLEKKEHQIKRPGLASHMASDKGQENIKSVESTYPVVIKMGRGEEETEFATFRSGKSTQGPDIGANIYAGGDAYDDRKVYTAEGDMSQIRVDVIVNSADSSISLSGGLGKVLATKGGSDITRECKDYVRQFGKLNTGDVFISSAGNLPSQFIVHVSCPHWENGRRKENEILKEVVFKAMQLATVKAARSIAIPALGCGNYGFPLKVATEIIANAVKDFFREVQESTIMEVFLVDVKPVTVEAFTEAIKDVFDNVREMSPTRSNSDDDQRPYRPVPQPRRSMPQHGDSSSSDDDDDDDSGTDRSAAFGGISVDVVKAEIASAKVDVIVNTTGKNLDLRNGAVSASLLRAGGETLQKDLNKNYPKGLADDEIAISVGGNLNCSNVFHGSMMNWDGGDKAVPALHKLMSCCLQEADKRKAKSIAFPAIGTGQLGFPRDIVAKEMFSAISNFASKNPKSSIKEVKFFIYQKDFATVKAFEFEKKNWSGGRRQSKRASRDVGPLHPRKMHDDDGEWVKVASPKADGSLDIGGISISVSQGDITQAKEDCIINSSNEELDLGRGAVAKALLAKGGDKLRKEAASKASEMKQNQFAMTSAPGLPCKCIIHVVAQDSEAEWKSVIEKCLKMADDNKVQSIAFPALGTGMNTKPKDSAKMTLKAVQSFVSQSPRNLKRVNFIIFQDKMMKEFKQAISSFKTEKSSSMLGDAWKYVKGKFDDRFGRQTSRSDGGSLQTNLGADPNVVNFIFYSLSMNDIDSAITKLEKLIDSELVSRILKDSFVEQLTKDQIRELQAMAFQQQVELNIKQDQKQLTMAGISKHVMDFTDKVQRFLREMERFENEKSQAELLKNVVQWYFIEITDVGQNLVNYTPQLNFRIEKAFKEQKSKLQFQDAEGDNYEIDFAALEEYPVSNPKDTVKILRKDLIKESVGVEIPSNWTTMGKTENLKVVTLQTTDAEYQNVVAQFNATGGGNFNVIKIDRVQNVTLYQQYQARKKLLDQQNPSGTQNERILWHGTAPEAVDSINAHGFNRSYCGKNATAFGDGVYFAVQVSYSAQNTYSRPDPNGVKRMYLTRVLTGEYIVGKNGMRVPPQKPSAAASHALYDSVVNNVQNPGMFIIFNDTQAYPDYLITFK